MLFGRKGDVSLLDLCGYGIIRNDQQPSKIHNLFGRFIAFVLMAAQRSKIENHSLMDMGFWGSDYI